MRDAIKELFPPGIPAIHRWRLVIAGVCAVALAHAALAFGLIGDGFARNSDVADIKRELLEQQLFDSRLKQCQLPIEQRRFYTPRIQDLMRRYREATGVEYRLPPCDEL